MFSSEAKLSKRFGFLFPAVKLHGGNFWVTAPCCKVTGFESCGRKLASCFIFIINVI